MAYYRKKPVIIEAFRLGHDALPSWGRSRSLVINYSPDSRDILEGAHIETLEGRMQALPGDWIIKGIKGELYPCKHEIFVETYEIDGSK